MKRECIGEFMTVSQAAREAGCTGQGVRAAIKRGRLRGERVGQIWLIHRKDWRKFRDGDK